MSSAPPTSSPERSIETAEPVPMLIAWLERLLAIMTAPLLGRLLRAPWANRLRANLRNAIAELHHLATRPAAAVPAQGAPEAPARPRLLCDNPHPEARPPAARPPRQAIMPRRHAAPAHPAPILSSVTRPHRRTRSPPSAANAA